MSTFTIQSCKQPFDQPETVEIQDPEGNVLIATVVPHTKEFSVFLEKSKKHNPSYSIIDHLVEFEEYKEYLIVKSSFSKMARERKQNEKKGNCEVEGVPNLFNY